ncbi:adenosylhomocysteinase [Candidatus Peregrinibacteria bacterium]|nr:adenosylhomocysteinase [Candidatus Peregrinibacteria bacterium]
MNKKNLALQGRNNIELAEKNMGALMKLRENFARLKPFKGLKIAMALHITKETAALVRTFIAGGANVAITSCNPLSTQDDVAEALKADGIAAYGYKGETGREYYSFLNKVLDIKPNITIDDGCDLVTQIHLKRPTLLREIIGGCEETTTGIIRLRAMERDRALKYPIIAVNDNKTKHLMDNYYGTGQSTINGIIRATNVLFAGKTVVIAGYGDCGKGCAMRAKGMGANVIVTEVDAFPALQAQMDGFRVMPMKDAAPKGDIFITVTGNKHVIRVEHVHTMKNGAILANSGHFDIEIDVAGIKKAATQKKQIRPFMTRYTFGKRGSAHGKEVYVLADGRLVNLSAAEGHPSEVMSMSFCGQALACEYLVQHNGVKGKNPLKPGVHYLPEEIDQKIASLQLGVMGVKIDKLTPEQVRYLKEWKEGTN